MDWLPGRISFSSPRHSNLLRGLLLEAQSSFQPSEGLHLFDREECAEEHDQQHDCAFDEKTNLRSEEINMRSRKHEDKSGRNSHGRRAHKRPLEGFSIGNHGSHIQTRSVAGGRVCAV
jgi:hypothetical protein